MNGERITRPWLAAGVLAGLLVGGVTVATAMVADPDPDGAVPSIALDYVATDGATCVVEIHPGVRPAAPSAWWVARGYLLSVDLQSREFERFIADAPSGGGIVDREVDSLVEALSLGAEHEILRRIQARVDVVLTADYSCTVSTTVDDGAVIPAIVGDDFGRVPTRNPGRTPDAVGFFRASTGQICEIQVWVEADRANGAVGDEAALAARAALASTDFTTVDYSATLRDLADFWPDGYDAGEAEASALSQTLARQVLQLFDSSHAASLPITTEGWSQCDPAP